MSRTYKRLDDIPQLKLKELRSSTQFRTRAMLFNIMPACFIMASLAFLAVILLGVIPQAESEYPSPVWPALLVVSAMGIGVLIVLVKKLLQPMYRANALSTAASRGLTPLVLAAALSESICIYALIGPPLDMPKIAQIGLWTFGFLVLVGSVFWVRGQVLTVMLLALANEQHRSGT